MPVSTKQEQFERTMSPRVYRRGWLYACRLCITREDAEDLLQEALTQAYRGIDSLRHPERAGAWLISIIRNCHLRKCQRKRVLIADSCWLQEVQDRGTQNPLAEPIADALASLPHAQREILSLFYLDGLNLEETAMVLGVSAQAVGQRLYRARRALRRVLPEPRILGILPQRCRQ